jgi:hypothetical protein
MPITPFHFGPGAAIHSLAPKRIRFAAFCAANCLWRIISLGDLHLYCLLAGLVGAAILGLRKSMRS